MVEEWYYKSGDLVLGPVSRQELDYLLSVGRIAAETPVRKSNEVVFRPAGPPGNVRSVPRRSVTTTRRVETQFEPATAGPSSTDIPPSVPDPPDPPDAVNSRGKPLLTAAIVLAILMIFLLVWWLKDGAIRMAADRGTDAPAESSNDESIPEETPLQSNDDGTRPTAVNEVADSEQTASALSEAASRVASAVSAPASEESLDNQQSTANADDSVESAQRAELSTRDRQTARMKRLSAGDAASPFTIDAGDEVSFFGVRAIGRRFVFVVDCSASMSGPPLQRATEELMRCVEAMPERVEVFVVFFDSVLHNKRIGTSRSGYFSPTVRNTERLDSWVRQEIVAGGGTDVRQALLHAMTLPDAPDVIFLLTDGEFEDSIPGEVRQLNRKPISINTIGLVSNAGERLLRQIAHENRGDYRFVP